jgi:hypothetical protein
MGLHFSRAEASLYGEPIGGISDNIKIVKRFEGKEDTQKPALMF